MISYDKCNGEKEQRIVGQEKPREWFCYLKNMEMSVIQQRDTNDGSV